MAKLVKIWIEPIYNQQEVLKSPEMEAELLKAAEEIAARAGEGFEAQIKRGKSRTKVNVVATTAQAHYSNLKHNTLLKAMNGVKKARKAAEQQK